MVSEPSDFLTVLLEDLDAGRSGNIFFDVQVGKIFCIPLLPQILDLLLTLD